MRFLNTTNNGKNFTIHFETDDPAEAERISQFIHDPHSAGMSDDLKAEMHLIIEDRNLLKQTVDALTAELQATKDCLDNTNTDLCRVARARDEANRSLDKTRADRDILAQDLVDVKGQLETAKKLLCRETREHDHVATESFNIVMGLLRAEGYNVESLMNRAAAIYVLRHPLK